MLTRLSLVLLLALPLIAIAGQPQRVLPFTMVENARDLGGYQAADGRTVRWGRLYRSASIADMDQSDLDLMAGLGLATVMDFRSPAERAEAPDRLPAQEPAIEYRSLSLTDPAVDVEALRHRVFSGQLSEAELLALMDRRAYVNDPVLRDAWGGWLRSLAEPGALPQLFHCTAGKDRTGYAAALVLLVLGVSREQVMEDFLLSNELLADRIEAVTTQIEARSDAALDPGLIAQIVGVSAHSLEDAFAEMEAQYGSIDGYLTQGLGIDEKTRQSLQALLLE